MKAFLTLLVLQSLASSLAATEAHVGFDATVRISIGAQPRQPFLAFGTSQPGRGHDGFRTNYLMAYEAPRRDRMLDLVYRDLGVDVLRLWLTYGEGASLMSMKDAFYRAYIDNGMLSAIQGRGVKSLLLAPGRGEKAPSETMQRYASRLAQFIKDVATERGIKIDVTGIANEPAGFTPSQLVEAVRLLRQELDSRELQHVGIIAPEWASVDSHLLRVVDAIKADPRAWTALRGIASHTYNMGANSAIVSRLEGSGKEYWQTEAGKTTLPRGIDEQPGDASEAASVAARFLSDMNHWVTHWFWFIGVNVYDPHPFGDAGQELVRPDNTTGQLKISTKYRYLKQLVNRTFDRGAVFRNATSDTEKDMGWTFGEKPAITVAAAKNPDGTWGIGVVNTTGVRSRTIRSPPKESLRISWHKPEARFRVLIRLPEAINGTFAAHRSSATSDITREENVLAAAGEIAVSVGPRELVTLRSVPR